MTTSLSTILCLPILFPWAPVCRHFPPSLGEQHSSYSDQFGACIDASTCRPSVLIIPHHSSWDDSLSFATLFFRSCSGPNVFTAASHPIIVMYYNSFASFDASTSLSKSPTTCSTILHVLPVVTPLLVAVGSHTLAD